MKMETIIETLADIKATTNDDIAAMKIDDLIESLQNYSVKNNYMRFDLFKLRLIQTRYCNDCQSLFLKTAAVTRNGIEIVQCIECSYVFARFHSNRRSR